MPATTYTHLLLVAVNCPSFIAQPRLIRLMDGDGNLRSTKLPLVRVLILVQCVRLVKCLFVIKDEFPGKFMIISLFFK